MERGLEEYFQHQMYHVPSIIRRLVYPSYNVQ